MKNKWKIEHLKTSGLQDKALYDYTFARVNGINPEIKLAHNYVSNWEEMRANASGLLIWGDVGTGKSFFAGCIANALLEKGSSCTDDQLFPNSKYPYRNAF